MAPLFSVAERGCMLTPAWARYVLQMPVPAVKNVMTCPRARVPNDRTMCDWGAHAEVDGRRRGADALAPSSAGAHCAMVCAM